MQDDFRHKRSYRYFLAFLQEALSENVLAKIISKEEIRQIVRSEFDLLVSKQNKITNDLLITKPLEKVLRANFSSKIGWLKGENSFIRFYELLISHGFIACDFDIFKAHFTGNSEETNFLVWLTQTKRLVYLIHQLAIYKFIPENKHPHQLLTEHFVNKQRKALKQGSLRSLLNSVRNNKAIKIIDGIILSLDKIKN